MTSVLHINNPAGIATHLSDIQNELGMQSEVLIQGEDPFNYGYDYDTNSNLFSHNNSVVLRSFEILVDLVKTLQVSNNYDIIHFHSSSILDFNKRFFPRGIDVPLFKLADTAIIVHHHGSNLRGAQEPFFHRHFADKILVSTPDLLQWNPDATWIPNPVDVESIPYIGMPNSEPPYKIVHAPSDRRVKGTKFVIDAVDELKRFGFSVNLEIVENSSRQKVLEHFRSADVVVDQLKLGWYGVVSVEAMATGKPVCVYIDDKHKPVGFETPLVETTPESLANDIAKLLKDYTKRKRLGRGGREFAEAIHQRSVVAKEVAEVYEDLL